MITCPGCQRSLPDWAQRCQFCNADTKSVLRPKEEVRQLNYYEPAKWVWVTYYLISVYFILGGGIDIILGLMPKGSTLTLILGAWSALLGIGLIFRIEFIRGIVNFFCAVQILFGFLGLIGSLFGMFFVGPWAILFLIFNLLDIVTGGLMIYLIGETDKGTNI